jgi:predicted Zn-dependent protease
MGALGAGAQYGILMPFGRDHESEADHIGLLYMARAGYDPREAIGFWERMAKASGGNAPPEFMSTHPSHGTRIERIKALLPQAMEEYEKSVNR